MMAIIGWSWNDIQFLTYKELNWAWEAVTEQNEDNLSLFRYELQKLTAIVCRIGGGKAPMPNLQDLNPLKIKR